MLVSENGSAIRAAFKAATDGKQVAVLFHHDFGVSTLPKFQRKIERFSCQYFVFEPFPFCKQKNETKEGLKNGKIDIVIGTQSIGWKRYRIQRFRYF